MDMRLTALLHAAHRLGCLGADRAFRSALRRPEEAQRKRLQAVLERAPDPLWPDLDRHWTYETFRDRVAPATYEDLAHRLASWRDGRPGAAVRWQPTSGSTSHRKWIPYTQGLLDEFNAAAGAWVADLSRRHPGAFRGRQYWSLSWMPDELREAGMDADDLSLLPGWKRWALGRTMAVPPEVAHLPSSAESLLATAAWLAACDRLTLISVWSPTFALSLMRTLVDHRPLLAEGLRTGTWPWGAGPRHPRQATLLREAGGALEPAFFRALWPHLALVSAWEDASSAPHAARLRALLPEVAFQGKGLWATEGVVSIPFGCLRPLALTSHFLEFRCLATGRILPAWGLEPGQEVQPLLSTSGGLLRCALDDRLQVTDFLERTPCVAFLGRLGGTDLVGEKLDEAEVSRLLEALEQTHGARCLALFAVQADPCHYALLVEGTPADPELTRDLECRLQAFHHYLLARELGQLGPAVTWFVPQSSELLERVAFARGQGLGEAKPRRLDCWPKGLLRPRPESPTG